MGAGSARQLKGESMRKKLFAYINTESEFEENVAEAVNRYFLNGADGLFLYSYIAEDAYKEEFFHMIKRVTEELVLPYYVGCHVARFEDVKKAFYTGASAVVIPADGLSDWEVIKESVDRFGGDKIFVELNAAKADSEEGVAALSAKAAKACGLGAGGIMFKHVTIGPCMAAYLKTLTVPVMIRDSLVRNSVEDILGTEGVSILATNYYKNKDIRRVKENLTVGGIDMCHLESSLPFSEFKKDANGLVPVVVQDYRSKEVLMLAYMNEESYHKTIEDGRMTYYSRSRRELWLKGETSGNYQYVKSLSLDCDKDTILAKVYPVGPACHTGHTSCFFTELTEEVKETLSPQEVLEELYATIVDRKAHPKEGSYTNYLFDKGIDKILKKVGEEAAEIIIAAKNPDPEEVKYEISDFLYHVMVLMAERGVTWEDITRELAQR